MNIGDSIKDLLYLCVHKSISRYGGVADSVGYCVAHLAAVILNGEVREATRDSVYAAVWDSIEDEL